jgi:hypothetical protein
MSDLYRSDGSVPLSLRVPVALKERLEALAKKRDRSVSAEVVDRLQASVWPSRSPAALRALEALEMPRALRIRDSSTSGDVSNVLDLVDGLGVDQLTFAARACDLNRAVLVLILESPKLYALLDTSFLNLARQPRVNEVADLLSALDARGLLANANYLPALLEPHPRGVPLPEPAVALEEIRAKGGVPRKFEQRAFLDLLSQGSLYASDRFPVIKG